MPQRKVVFVVDNDAQTRESVAALLASSGRTVVPFETAEACLRAFESICPECIVSALNLPGMNGTQLIDALSVRNFAVPVVIVADGDTEPHSPASARDAGAATVLQRPFEDRELLNALAPVSLGE